MGWGVMARGCDGKGLDDGCKGVWWLVAVDGVGYERL